MGWIGATLEGVAACAATYLPSLRPPIRVLGLAGLLSQWACTFTALRLWSTYSASGLAWQANFAEGPHVPDGVTGKSEA